MFLFAHRISYLCKQRQIDRTSTPLLMNHYLLHWNYVYILITWNVFSMSCSNILSLSVSYVSIIKSPKTIYLMSFVTSIPPHMTLAPKHSISIDLHLFIIWLHLLKFPLWLTRIRKWFCQWNNWEKHQMRQLNSDLSKHIGVQWRYIHINVSELK